MVKARCLAPRSTIRHSALSLLDTIISILDWMSFLLTHHGHIKQAKNGEAMLAEIVLDKALQNCYF